jgi:hypothetical protein
LREAAFFRRSLRHCRSVPFSNVPRALRRIGRVRNKFAQFINFRLNIFFFRRSARLFSRSVVAARLGEKTRDAAPLSPYRPRPPFALELF